MNKSEEIKDLIVSLIKAQGEMSNPVFDAKNPHFKSKFASLASVRRAVLPALLKHDITVTQLLGNDDNGSLKCETILFHKTGQWLSNILIVPGKMDAHGIGSSATYARRYSLMSIVCVVGDEDDDGNACIPSNRKITPEQCGQLRKILTEADLITDKVYMKKLLNWLKVDSFEELSVDKFATARNGILVKIKRDK